MSDELTLRQIAMNEPERPRMKTNPISLLVAICLLLASAGFAVASSKPILKITLDGEVQEFSLADLQGFEPTTVTTSTIWTEGVQTFEGISLKVLLDHLSVSSGTITATAINDYAVELPVSDAVVDGPIVAYLHSGKEMSVREKGPLWIIYPYDENKDYQTEVIYSRSIWQLNRMEIKN